MLPLRELQGHIAHAMIHDEMDRLPAALTAGLDPNRLTLHARHYTHSLVMALMDKFPATQWLIGNTALRAAASLYIRAEPPRRPCIAEYGASFPAFLASQPPLAGLPYLGDFATLEWMVGKAAIAITSSPLDWQTLSAGSMDMLLKRQVALQPGTFHLRVNWPVDSVLRHFLEGSAPETLTLNARHLYLEIHGARGTFTINRLAAGDFRFRQALAAGTTLGTAAESALDHDAGFDTGLALRQLVEAGLVVQPTTFPGDHDQ